MSVYGNAIMLGGGGGLKATDALLRVQAPAGSTVTITKGTTTKTDLGHENADDHSVYDYYFIIHQSQFDSINPWTVTATLGSDTATAQIVVNAADEYDLELSYKFYLYKSGDQSGWTAYGWKAHSSLTASAPSITYGVSALDLIEANSASSGIAYYSVKLDLSDYETIGAVGDFTSSSATACGLFVLSAINGSGLYQDQAVASGLLGQGTFSDYELTMDVSALSGEYYIAFGLIRSSAGQSHYIIDEVYAK